MQNSSSWVQCNYAIQIKVVGLTFFLYFVKKRLKVNSPRYFVVFRFSVARLWAGRMGSAQKFSEILEKSYLFVKRETLYEKVTSRRGNWKNFYKKVRNNGTERFAFSPVVKKIFVSTSKTYLNL